MSATEFKAHCFELLDRVLKSGEVIQVTKRGKVVAQLGPPSSEHQARPGPGFAKDQFTIVGDIMEPSDLEWEVMGDLDNSQDPLVKSVKQMGRRAI